MDSALLASIEIERSHRLPTEEANLVQNNVQETESLGCCSPKRSWYRFAALLFMCFISFGSYYCYDMPGALQDQIKTDMHVDTAQFATLYSYYSWPNVVLCFVGGFLIDSVFGVRMGTVICSTLVVVGHYISSIGALVETFWMMQFGRFIFGIGSESLAVAQNAYAVSWFKGKELNMVFGLLISMARVGSTVNFVSSGPIYAWADSFTGGYTTLGITLLIGGLTCVFSLICGAIIGFMDLYREKVLHVQRGEGDEQPKIRLKDVITFPVTFWLMSAICVAYYVAIFPFIGLAKVYFMQKYGMTEAGANGVSSVVYIISAVVSPIVGLMVDKIGRNIMWVLLSIIITLGCHMVIAFTMLNPFIPMSVLGCAYAILASSLWPMVSLILPEHMLGTAYGLMQSVQNLGLALITMCAGIIVDASGYFALELFFIAWLILALLSCFGIWYVDRRRDGTLNKSKSERDREELSSTEEREPLVQSLEI